MERLKVGTDEITLHASSAALLATEVTIPAGGGPPAMHRHPSEELYRVETGQLVLYRDHERIVAGPGTVVHIPGGVAHTVRNESDAPARAYVIFSPGTEMEAFVRAVAARPGDVKRLAEANGIEFVPPVDWGARARAWARTEEQQRETYLEALRRIELRPGAQVLDVGCGAGEFVRLVSERGARAFGLDASPELIALARERVPAAELQVGGMDALPYADDAFDAVFGFNAFFFAEDMVAALREARRVARPGAPVVIQVWGDPERCDLTRMKDAVFSLAASDGPPPPPLWKPGVLEDVARAAGLTPGDAFDLEYPFHYADEDELVELLMAPGPVVAAARAAGADRVRDAIVTSLRPLRRPDGSFALSNRWRYLIAAA